MMIKQTSKPELISFSDFLMIAPFFDQRQFFAPEIENMKGGIDTLMQSGLISDTDSELVEIDGQTAILRINGPLRPGRGWNYSVGYGDIQDAIIELIDNQRIDTVIQIIDSPGGTVKQAFETHEMFQELAKHKTLIALVTGSATSAAALMTFPAKQRFIASKTAQTGSIGVVAEHINNVAWYREYLGEIRTSVAKGKMKDAGTDVRPYDAKAKEVFESAVSKLYDVFADEAVKGLNLTREEIDGMESRVFIGSDGIDQGFADGFSTLPELIEQSNNQNFSTPGRPAFSNNPKEVKLMDKNQLKAEFPDVYQAVLTEGSEALKETHATEGKAAGILMERKRMNDIDALGLPAETAKAAKESDISAEKAAADFLKAQAATLAAKKTDIEGELNEPLASDTPADAKPPECDAKDPVKDFKAAVDEQVKGGLKRTDAIKAVAKANPELHQSYITALNGGKNE